jgi:uncharacterized protein YutE (UPF0331/DUF86 family)
MLNKDFILRKIKLIQEDLARLEPLSKAALGLAEKDSIEYAATERMLERIVTRAIDINKHLITELGKGSESVKTYQETFLALAQLMVYPEVFAKQISPSAGLRNILVHEYDEIKIDKVYQSAEQALVEYAKYCNFILEFINKQE